jgi:Arc/MetJ-type ribon-helix-helix transcriptional regulator
MPVSVRLDQSLQQRLERMARTSGRTKSDLIREAIIRLDEALGEAREQTLYEQFREYIGVVSLGRGARAARSDEQPGEAAGADGRAGET